VGAQMTRRGACRENYSPDSIDPSLIQAKMEQAALRAAGHARHAEGVNPIGRHLTGARQQARSRHLSARRRAVHPRVGRRRAIVVVIVSFRHILP